MPLRSALALAALALSAVSVPFVAAEANSEGRYTTYRVSEDGNPVYFGFRVKSDPDRIVREAYHVPLHCGPGRPLAYVGGTGRSDPVIRIGRNGRFRSSFKLGRLSTVLEGQVREGEIVGRFRSNGWCHTRSASNPWVRFKAQKRN